MKLNTKIDLSTNVKPDILGAVASGLCAIHCMATPFLFVMQSCSSTSSCCSASPFWWSAIDYIFMGITFFAIHHAGRKSKLHWMKSALYATWVILTILIFNEKLALLPISSLWKYISAFVLISLHLYNLRHCRCAEDTCCAVSPSQNYRLSLKEQS